MISFLLLQIKFIISIQSINISSKLTKLSHTIIVRQYYSSNCSCPQATRFLMNDYFLDSQELKSKFLIITFRKLLSKMPDLDDTKVIALVKVNTSQLLDPNFLEYQTACYQISHPRTIKNSMVCFYGQSLTISQKVRNFSIQIYAESSSGSVKNSFNKLLLSVNFGQDKLRELQKRKDVFSISSEFTQLVFEVSIGSNNGEKVEQKEQMSLDDIPDPSHIQQQSALQLIGRKIYSPAVRGEIRKKRQSFRFRANRKSELVSESPYKLTMDTDETLVKVKKRIKLVQPSNIKNEMYGKKQIGGQKNNRQQMNQNKKEMEYLDHPVFKKDKNTKKSKSKGKRISSKYHQPLTPQLKSRKGGKSQKSQKSQKRSERFFDQLSLKSILYTSMVGIIGGVAAAHF